MTAWPHGSPLLSSTTLSLPSNKTSDYYRHFTLFSFNKNTRNQWPYNYYAYFCVAIFQTNKTKRSGDICQVFSAGNLPHRAPLIQSASDSPLRSSHLVSPEASTQLANWANTHSSKLR